jgi:hypothetical protein
VSTISSPRPTNTPTPRSPVAIALTAGCLVIAAFQTALACGAPFGAATQGGSNPGQLPRDLRLLSGVIAVVWLVAALVVLARAGRPVVPLGQPVQRVGAWVLVGVLSIGTMLNFASSSPWERFGWGPFALLMLVLAVVLARSSPSITPPAAQSDRRAAEERGG